ncbi:vomeronasal type-1 receptor 4-like [Neovison vison]|uniref:vomeronasal type-1 receptor 4-like n=1 Tax=Neovison vison TaxID=452646 RepID=UPI001CF0A909|nr:vomeronasal type-1 receptor 4-like [Neogale vison]
MICVARSSYSHAGSSTREDRYQSLSTVRMATRDLAVGVIILIQTVVGILGNFCLLYHYLLLHFTGCRPRSTDLIVKNLIVANILVLFSLGIYESMSSFAWYHIVSDFGCKFFLYVRGVGRGVSIGTTCLLSIFQAITISPRNSRWAALKGKAPKCIVPSIVLCWVIQILVNIMYPLFMTITLKNKNITNRKSFGHCSSFRHEKNNDLLYVALLSFPDVVYLGLMLSASSSMVFYLYRHKQRVQNILRMNISSSSPESTATKTILLLVSTFVYFNTLSSIFRIILGIFDYLSWYILNASLIITLCFPILSPFLLLSRDPRISVVCFAWIRNVKSPHVMRNM